MNDEVFKGMAAAIQPITEQLAKINTDELLAGLTPALKMYCDTLKIVNPSESLIRSMAVLVQTYGQLSELQLIALSKEAKPSEIDLTDAQKKIRAQITQQDAEVLKDAVSLNAEDGRFVYKDERISTAKVRTAVEIARLFDDITVDDILDFSETLYLYPYLALTHHIGKRIFDGCKSIQEEYLTSLDMEIPYFRAREMESEDSLFSDSEMDKAPFKIPGQGRFNTEGVARFYVSGNGDDSASEVIKHSKKEGMAHIQVAEYRASKQLRVFDFGKMNNKLSEKCMRNVPKPDKFNAEYLISGYLAQCLDYHKEIDGIKYGTPGHELYVFFQDRSFQHVNRSFVHRDRK